MKQISVLIFVLISLFQTQVCSAKEIIPPGCVKVNESIYVDRTEIRNIDYAEFVYWNLANKGIASEEYLASLPDTAVWEVDYYIPFATLYYQHPAYREYPVVGVSYNQAVAYCNWRSDRVNEYIYIKKNKIKIEELKNVKDIPQVFRYRLPTKQEWEEIAAISYSEEILKKMGNKKNKNLYRYNFINGRGEVLGVDASDNAEITAPVSSYWPNALGIYNLIGNVAEMTIEKGLAKGGSWIHKRDEALVGKDFVYEKPEKWLGFRCVCEKM